MYNQPDYSSYYKELQKKARSEILRESEKQIIGTETEELSKYFFEKYALTIIVEDPEREASWDIQDYLATIPAHERNRAYRYEGDLRDCPCQRVVVEVPILPNKNIKDIAQLGTSTFSISYSDSEFCWDNDKITSTIQTKGYGFEYDEERIAQEVRSVLKKIRESIYRNNSDIEEGNRELLAYIQDLIKGQKQKLAQDKEKLASLTKKIEIPLKKKTSAIEQSIRVAHKPLVQRVKPKPTLPEEYVLEESKVTDIVTLLDSQAKNYETTPRAVKELGEEDLRDLLLANLNSVFEGKATGETFSKKGKTDIYLKISKGNILICECKVWKGKSLCVKTINQLRGHLTWRHNYSIIITFVRIKDFSKVLRESAEVIQSHDSYLNGFRKLNDTHFISNHYVDDKEKVVKIHHLFYHLFIS